MRARVRNLEKQLITAEFWQDTLIAQNSLQELSDLIFREQEEYREWQTCLNDAKAALQLLESESDEQLEQELRTTYEFLSSKLKHVEILNLLNQPFDDKGAFVTITACDRNIDCQDWVEMLQRMYAHWCDNHDCKLRFLDESIGEFCGFNYVTLEISGKYAYGYLKSEQGIHQLKRISPFRKKPAIKTSFAKLEVAPIVDESMDFEIPQRDLEVLRGKHTYMRGPSPLAKVTHIPTGISVTSTEKRNHLANLEKALVCVKSKLFALMQIQGVALKDVKKPSPKTTLDNPIREYIFHPYQKVKDSRTNVETVEIEEVMKGNLDLFTKAYLKQMH
nr:PCRF domain-containing protein [Rivularia sp. PCC 7116]